MKKKIALLLAATMTFAAMIPGNLFADSRHSRTEFYNFSRSGFFATNRKIVEGDAAYNYGAADRFYDFGAPAYLRLRVDEDVYATDSFTLTLSNAQWAFDETTEAFFDRTGRDPWNGADTAADYYDGGFDDQRLFAADWDDGSSSTTDDESWKANSTLAAYETDFDGGLETIGDTSVIDALVVADAADTGVNKNDGKVVYDVGDEPVSGGSNHMDDRMNAADAGAPLAATKVSANDAKASSYGVGTTFSTTASAEVLPWKLSVSNFNLSEAVVEIKPGQGWVRELDDKGNTDETDDQWVYTYDENIDLFEVPADGELNVYIPLAFYSTNNDAVTLNMRTERGSAGSSAFTNFSNLALTETAGSATVSYDKASAPIGRNYWELDTFTFEEKRFGQFPAAGGAIEVMFVAPSGFRWTEDQLKYVNDSDNTIEVEWDNLGLLNADGIDTSELATLSHLSRSEGGGYREEGVWVRYQDGTITNYDTDQILVWRFEMKNSGRQLPREFTITGLKLEADSSVKDGDVTIRVIEPDNVVGIYSTRNAARDEDEDTDDNVADEQWYVRDGVGINVTTTNEDEDYVDLVAAVRQNYGINFYRGEESGDSIAEADIPQLWAGRTEQTASAVVFEENTPGSAWLNNETYFELVDAEGNSLANKVKFTEVRVLDEENVAGITASNETPVAFGEAGAKTGAVKLTDNIFSVDYRPTADNNLSWLSFEGDLSVAANFVGDVYLKASGRGVVGNSTNEDVPVLKIATVAAPVTVTSTTTNVQIGYQTIKVGDIKIVEAEAGLFQRGESVRIRLEAFGEGLAESLRFIDAQNIEFSYNSTNGGVLGKPSVSGQVIDIVVSRLSSTAPFELELKNVKALLDHTVPFGNYDFSVGGTAIVDNYVSGAIGTSTADAGKFNIFGVVYANYINVKTPGQNVALKPNVAFPDGSQNVLVNGVENVLSSPIYIDPVTGRTMIPLAAISKALGIEEKNIIWDDTEKKVTIITTERIVEFYSNTNKYTVNGAVQYMNENGVEVLTVNTTGRNYLPLAYLAQAYGITVAWNSATKTAYYNPTDADITGGAVIVTVPTALQ